MLQPANILNKHRIAANYNNKGKKEKETEKLQDKFIKCISAAMNATTKN